MHITNNKYKNSFNISTTNQSSSTSEHQKKKIPDLVNKLIANVGDEVLGAFVLNSRSNPNQDTLINGNLKHISPFYIDSDISVAEQNSSIKIRKVSLLSGKHTLQRSWIDDNWLTVDEYLEFLEKHKITQVLNKQKSDL